MFRSPQLLIMKSETSLSQPVACLKMVARDPSQGCPATVLKLLSIHLDRYCDRLLYKVDTNLIGCTAQSFADSKANLINPGWGKFEPCHRSSSNMQSYGWMSESVSGVGTT
jgi:hypothetical protein